jgi:hypothetical protein
MAIALLAFAASRAFLLFGFEPPGSDVAWVYQVYAWEHELAAARGQPLYAFHAAQYEKARARATARGEGGPLFESQWIEYPPLALRLVVLATSFATPSPVPAWSGEDSPPAGDIRGYAHAFRSLMAVIDAVGFTCLLWLVPRLYPRESPGRGLERALVYVLAGHILGYTTYDRITLGAGVLVLAAVALLVWRRLPAAAGLAVLALAVTYQVSPIVLVPVMVLGALPVERVRGAWGGLLAACAARGLLVAGCIAALFVPFYLYEGPSTLGLLRFHALRRLHVESVPATLPLVLSLLGLPVRVVGEFNCWDLDSPLSPALVALSMPLTLALVGAVSLAVVRRLRGRPDLQTSERLAVAAAPAFAGFVLASYAIAIVGSKVFSPQYLLWILPLAPLAPGPRRIPWAFVALAVLTTAVFPYCYDSDVARAATDALTGETTYGPTTLGVLLLAARNLATVGFAAVVLRASLRQLDAVRGVSA